MSTLNVSNITDGTTTVGTGYVVNGSSKCWANWNGTGTIAIRDSLNVSSLTDIGTGQHKVNISSAMAAADYAIAATAGTPTIRDGVGMAPQTTFSSTAFQVRGGASNALDTPYDHTVVSGIIFGDLA